MFSFLATHTSLAHADSPSASASYFPGRSGDVTLLVCADAACDTTAAKAGVLLSLDSPSQSDQPLALERAADLAAHALGLLPLVDGEPVAYAAFDLWRPAAAHISIVVPGLDGSYSLLVGTNDHLADPDPCALLTCMHHSPARRTVDAAATPQLARASARTLTGGSQPSSYVADTVTAITGRPPAHHGIVAGAWYDRTAGAAVRAWASPASGALRGNLADLASQSSAGRALTVSFASSAILASGLNVHPLAAGCPAAQLAAVALALDWTARRVTVQSCLDALNADALADALSAGIAADATPLEQELAVLKALPAALATQPALAAALVDGTADVFVLLLDSLAELVHAHGADAPSVLAAQSAVDAALSTALDSFAGLYANAAPLSRHVIALTATESTPRSPAADYARLVAALAGSAVPLLGRWDGSQLVLQSASRAALPGACAELATAVEPLGLSVFCAGAGAPVHEQPVRLASVRAASTIYIANITNSTIYYNDSYVLVFQTAFWTAVLLALVFLGSIYALCYMHIPYDANLQLLDVKGAGTRD